MSRGRGIRRVSPIPFQKVPKVSSVFTGVELIKIKGNDIQEYINRNLVEPVKTKENLEKEWQEFTKEQEKAFAELLIEKGIKKQESIITNTNT